MSQLRILLAFSCVFVAGASCGSGRPPPEENPGPSEPSASETPEQVSPAGGESAEVVPLPALPEPEAAAAERTPPTIANLSDAEGALSAGFYAAVRDALPRLGADSKWLRARLLFETGEYDEAQRVAVTVTGPNQRPAKWLAAEAHMARGRLDEAQRLLEPFASDESAHRAHLLLGRLYARRGRRAEARVAFMKLIQAYNGEAITDQPELLGYVGMAAWGLGSARDANDAFGEASRQPGCRPPLPQSPGAQGTSGAAANRPPPCPNSPVEGARSVETQLEWARLFLAKYDAGHAEENVQAVLEHNPAHPEALALMARVRVDQSYDFAAAEELSNAALAGNPSLVAAHVNLAGLALRDLDIEQADAHLDRALAVDPNDLEALSTRAAVRYLADDEQAYEAARREVFRRHRTYSDFYDIIGDFAEWEHRYPDIVQMSRDAITLNSGDETALASLGMNLLRMGDEEAGLQALRDAWSRDRFNVRVYNTLNLYDDVIPQQYGTVDAAPFVFRFHNDERAVLERYVPRTLSRAYRDMVRRYGFTPEGPVRVELFADTSHFAVRTTGLPNLGVQGVCFGKVVTSISPAGGPFNWGQIDWHELAHVFHIQLSQNHVPRWFTEGLAEYETLIARPEWKREMDHYLWQALESDRLPPLRLMNRAFTRARSAMGVMVAYYASTHIVRYIADEYGFDKIVRMLREWGAGRRTEEVVQRVLGVDIDTLDRNFRAEERQRLAARANDFGVDFESYTDLATHAAAAAAAPNDANAIAAHSAAMLVAGDGEGAERVARAALGKDPRQPVAHFVLARIHSARGEAAEAESQLRAIIEGGRDGYEIRLVLARSALGREDNDAARRELLAATRIDGERLEAWHGLRELAERLSDAALTRQALDRIVRIDEHDRRANGELLAQLVAAEDWDAALEIGEMALFVDPHNAQSHRLLAQVYLRKDRADDALYEADTALLAGHEQPGEVQLLRAEAFRALRRPRETRQAAEAAVAADAALRPRAEALIPGR